MRGGPALLHEVRERDAAHAQLGAGLAPQRGQDLLLAGHAHEAAARAAGAATAAAVPERRQQRVQVCGGVLRLQLRAQHAVRQHRVERAALRRLPAPAEQAGRLNPT